MAKFSGFGSPIFRRELDRKYRDAIEATPRRESGVISKYEKDIARFIDLKRLIEQRTERKTIQFK